MAVIAVSDLTVGEGTLTGTGAFDVLMTAVEKHVEAEYKKGRIKGGDYATVYLGAMQSVMDRALQMLLQQQRADQEAELLREQILTEQLKQTQLTAQTAQIEQQTSNLTAEALNIPKQGAVLDAQAAVQEQQKLNLVAEKLQTDAQTALVDQQTTNAITENTVLVAQECKLRGEYDLIMEQKLKTVAETALLMQKKVTEQAQTSGTGVGPDSVIGKQIQLYDAQRKGYLRDAEQKAAKLLVDTWNVRKTMDDTTLADGTNNLSDVKVGDAVRTMLQGVEAWTETP